MQFMEFNSHRVWERMTLRGDFYDYGRGKLAQRELPHSLPKWLLGVRSGALHGATHVHHYQPGTLREPWLDF